MGPHQHREEEEARLLAEPLLQRRREAQLELETEEPLVRRSPWVNWAGTYPLPEPTQQESVGQLGGHPSPTPTVPEPTWQRATTRAATSDERTRRIT